MKTATRSFFHFRRCFRCASILVLLGTSLICAAQSQPQPASVSIDWNKTILISRSTPTLQVVVNPMLRQGSPIHDAAFRALRDLGAEDVRYVPWFPYPKLAVAELQPPTAEKTSWDFSLIDPMTRDFLAATSGHATVMNFSTIPAWLFHTPKPVSYPADPNQVDWDYTQGTQLKDPSGKQLGDYYARLVSWYTRGGFIDENGKKHVSGYHYTFPIWEVLNEVGYEHSTTPEQYTRRYDAIVSAIHAVSPNTKFMGLALAYEKDPRWFEYFLNHENHRPGIPIDYISYHFYASPAPGENVNTWQYSFFNQADGFLNSVRYINAIRNRLSPTTKIDTDELGVILPDDNLQVANSTGYVSSIPQIYWNAAGALYAYLYIGLAQQGIDIVGESQLVGYPSQFPSVSMIDWVTGKPNARYWVLKLLKDNFHPGDKLVESKIDPDSSVTAQAFLTSTGKKLLLVNKRNHASAITLPDSTAIASIDRVDESTKEGPPQKLQLSHDRIELAPFAVAVVRWK